MAIYEYVRSDMIGKTCIVTGANSGIGFVAAYELAASGADVVMICRDKTRGEQARATIAESGAKTPELVLCDFSSLTQVRDVAEELAGRSRPIDVLLNNAGLIAQDRIVTEDGFELTFQVNHLAHFLLTNRLLDAVKTAPQGRVVNVSSGAHFRTFSGINFKDIHFERRWSPFTSYAHSKLANVLFSYELDRRLAGSKATSNAVHPGGVDSGFGGGWSSLFGIAWNAIRPLLLSPSEGAETLVYLTLAAEVAEVSGGYFYKMRPVKSSPISYDEDMAARLWDVSAEMTGIG